MTLGHQIWQVGGATMCWCPFIWRCEAKRWRGRFTLKAVWFVVWRASCLTTAALGYGGEAVVSRFWWSGLVRDVREGLCIKDLLGQSPVLGEGGHSPR